MCAVINEGEAKVLRLNVWHSKELVTDPTLLSIRSVVDDADLLVTPLFEWTSSRRRMGYRRCTELATGTNRRKLIGSQDVFILLRSSLSALKSNFWCDALQQWTLFIVSRILQAPFSRLTNCDLYDEQWLKTSLPVKLFGDLCRPISTSIQ